MGSPVNYTDTFTYPKVYLYRRVLQAKLFIDTHFHEAINLDSVSEEATFSKFHFIRLFKKTYGKTPNQYLQYVRIDKARELLKSGNSVSDVCHSVGFDSLSTFAGLFKRMTGMAPSEYQKRQKNIEKEIASIPLKFIPNCFAEAKGWK